MHRIEVSRLILNILLASINLDRIPRECRRVYAFVFIIQVQDSIDQAFGELLAVRRVHKASPRAFTFALHAHCKSLFCLFLLELLDVSFGSELILQLSEVTMILIVLVEYDLKHIVEQDVFFMRFRDSRSSLQVRTFVDFDDLSRFDDRLTD